MRDYSGRRFDEERAGCKETNYFYVTDVSGIAGSFLRSRIYTRLRLEIVMAFQG